MATYTVIKATPKPKPQSGEEGGPAVISSGPDGVQVVTFGCRLNAYESEAIRARAAADGVTDAVVFNTCAVTSEAVRQAGVRGDSLEILNVHDCCSARFLHARTLLARFNV